MHIDIGQKDLRICDISLSTAFGYYNVIICFG